MSKKMEVTVEVNGKIPVTWNGKVVKCKGCGAWIGWGETASGKLMPFDHGDPKFTSHWATCPKASQFRQGAVDKPGDEGG